MHSSRRRESRMRPSLGSCQWGCPGCGVSSHATSSLGPARAHGLSHDRCERTILCMFTRSENQKRGPRSPWLAQQVHWGPDVGQGAPGVRWTAAAEGPHPGHRPPQPSPPLPLPSRSPNDAGMPQPSPGSHAGDHGAFTVLSKFPTGASRHLNQPTSQNAVTLLPQPHPARDADATPQGPGWVLMAPPARACE